MRLDIAILYFDEVISNSTLLQLYNLMECQLWDETERTYAKITMCRTLAAQSAFLNRFKKTKTKDFFIYQTNHLQAKIKQSVIVFEIYDLIMQKQHTKYLVDLFF